jgi:hypothetical protein
MSNVEYIKNPVFMSENGSRIDCIVKFDSVPIELPFLADANDIEPHGRAIHAAILAGEAGEIEPYVPPSEPVQKPVIEGLGGPVVV